MINTIAGHRSGCVAAARAGVEDGMGDLEVVEQMLRREGATTMNKASTQERTTQLHTRTGTPVPRPAQVGGTPSADSPTGAGAGNGLTRVTVNLNRQAIQALETVSEATGYSKTDTINRALQVYAIIQDIMQRNGGALHIKHMSGELERIHIV
jgi:hypothetical protein